MSGVYIKGIEMPSGCDDCYFCGEMGICSVLVATHINSGIVCEYRYNEFERPPFCPLIHVPAHGRLIDADKLRTDIKFGKNRFGSSTFLDYYDVSTIKNAPTIIEAEE